MKIRMTSLLVLFSLLGSLAFGSPKKQPLQHRLIHNCDGTIVLGNFLFNQRPLSLSDVNAYVDAYANTQVTTFMMCSGSDYFYYRSKYGRIFGDDRNGTLNCGKDTANYRYMVSYYRNHLNLEKEGTDIVDACLRRAKEKKMETFLSYRMNDLHFNDTTTRCPVEYTDFWLANPQYWLNENVGWKSNGAFDYAHKEVRDRKLDIITEQLEKYGDLIDGYDLDFMRFPVYFKSSECVKNAPLMTQLVMEIKGRIDQLSAKRGKKILLSARIPPDLDFCLQMGFDVKEWIRLGLLDFITIGVFFNGNAVLPVAKFKSDLDEPSIPVYGSTENGGYAPRQEFSHGIYRGMASHILAQGGDGIYLFNYFFDGYIGKYNNTLHLEEGGYVCKVIMPQLLNEMGSLETLRKRNKIYCMDDGSSAEFRFKPKTVLPLMLSAGNSSEATIFIGDNTQKEVPKEAILFLRMDHPGIVEIFVNNQKVKIQKPEYVSLFDRGQNLRKNEIVYAFILPQSCLKQGDNIIRFHSLDGESLTVKRVELALKYGDVKTHGYF